MPSPELELVEALAQRLSAYGEVSLVYLTAEFQPFSNAQRPDLLFRPSAGGRTGQAAIVEWKVEAAPRASGRSFLNLIDHKEFCEESLEDAIYRYVFVTNQEVPEFSEAQLARSGVSVLRFSGDLDDLVVNLLVALEVNSGG